MNDYKSHGMKFKLVMSKVMLKNTTKYCKGLALILQNNLTVQHLPFKIKS